MSNPWFRFKKFTVWQDRPCMKVTTDAVLLGAWVEVTRARKILDVGTGTGLLALMMAQRSEALIDALEIEPEAAEQAEKNILASAWKDRIRVIHRSLQEFAGCSGQEYDRIVTNPPYFERSRRPEKIGKSLARHDTGLTHSELLQGAAVLLSPAGKFSLVLPYDRKMAFTRLAHEHGLYLNRELAVIPKQGAPPKRILMELSRKLTGGDSKSITILDRHDKFTGEYRRLTAEYYLE